MKAILMSIQPPHSCDILNLIKEWEIRKRFPLDYRGWVYIYVTKGNMNECLEYADNPDRNKEGRWCVTSGYPYANGKVIARFYCDKVEEIKFERVNDYSYNTFEYMTETLTENELLKLSCLSAEELNNYLKGKTGYAIHISQLEIFDEPKELWEFKYYKKHSCMDYMLPIPKRDNWETLEPLTKAPQSMMYIEID